MSTLQAVEDQPNIINDDTKRKLQQKYILLKKRVRDIEEDNDAIHVKLSKAMRQIKRLKVERIVLLEELDQSRRYGRGGGQQREGANKCGESDGSLSDTTTRTAPTATTDRYAPSFKAKRGGKLVAGPSGKGKGGGGARQPHERKKRDPNAPKGPGNVFFLYCRMERDNIKDQVSTDNLGEVTRLLGQKWKALSKEEKQVYYDLYNKELKDFEVAMEQYNANGGSTATTAPTSAVASPALTNKDEEDMLAEDDEEEDDDDDVDDDQQTTTTTMTDAPASTPVAPSTAPLPVSTMAEAPIDAATDLNRESKLSVATNPELQSSP